MYENIFYKSDDNQKMLIIMNTIQTEKRNEKYSTKNIV